MISNDRPTIVVRWSSDSVYKSKTVFSLGWSGPKNKQKKNYQKRSKKSKQNL